MSATVISNQSQKSLMIDLTNADLFRDLTTIVVNKNTFFDLHNDYDCTEINYQLENKTIVFLFQSNDPAKKDLRLQFEDAIIDNLKINLKRTPDSSTLDQLYRGRYITNDELVEFLPDGEGIFYVDFYDDDSFIIFAKKVTLLF